MRIAIVDDISEERTLLRNRLESQFSRRNVHVDIFEYENGELFLEAEKLNKVKHDLIFIDYEFEEKGKDGITIIRELRNLKKIQRLFLYQVMHKLFFRVLRLMHLDFW